MRPLVASGITHRGFCSLCREGFLFEQHWGAPFPPGCIRHMRPGPPKATRVSIIPEGPAFRGTFAYAGGRPGAHIHRWVRLTRDGKEVTVSETVCTWLGVARGNVPVPHLSQPSCKRDQQQKRLNFDGAQQTPVTKVPQSSICWPFSFFPVSPPPPAFVLASFWTRFDWWHLIQLILGRIPEALLGARLDPPPSGPGYPGLSKTLLRVE